jgi:hypothetical protein
MSQGNAGGPPPGGPLPGAYAQPWQPPAGVGAAPLSYESVPWFRKNGINSAFVLAGFFCFPPLLWTTCIIILTGPVYLDAYDKNGQLKQWGPANKVVAGILIVLQVAAVAARLLVR